MLCYGIDCGMYPSLKWSLSFLANFYFKKCVIFEIQIVKCGISIWKNTIKNGTLSHQTHFLPLSLSQKWRISGPVFKALAVINIVK